MDDQQHWELVKAVLRCGLLQSNLCGTAADAQAVSDYQQPFWAEDRCWVAAADLGSSVGTPRFLAETTMVQWNCWPGGRFETENREFIHLHTLTPEVVHKREPAEYAVPTFDGRGSSSVRHPLNDFTGQLIHSPILLVVLDSYPSFYLKGGFKSVTFPYSCYHALQVTRAHTQRQRQIHCRPPVPPNGPTGVHRVEASRLQTWYGGWFPDPAMGGSEGPRIFEEPN